MQKSKQQSSELIEPDITKIRVSYLPGHSPDGAHIESYRDAFMTWQSTWKEFYASLPVPQKLYSDSFTRQDEIGALFYENHCIGLSFFRWVDLATIDHLSDSFFKLWSDADLSVLASLGRIICIPSYLTVEKMYRRNNCSLDIRRLLLGLVTKRFLASAADVLPVVTRNQKGVNEVFYSHGAKPIKTNVVNFHKEDLVDLVAIQRTSAKFPEDLPYRQHLEHIWSTRTFVNSDLSVKYSTPIEVGQGLTRSHPVAS